ncbi:hypothetical protein SteCoe_30638 [Stentor coeruleus]|uniref:G-protein coupled receptors family 1 profile domain-containing protein n=1 Tax=Stentor coeruleus TaxID=5963 RepID=A0A1R2B3L7_9CILI|nr:hypothetical protein SteCoe_30638 [Stentor coeruleus]
MEYCLDREILYYSTLGTSAFSFFGSLTVVVIFIKLRKMQTYSLRLLFYISLSDLIRAIGLSVPCFYLRNQIIIRTVAFMIRTGNLSSPIWAIAISNALYKVAINGTQKFERHHRFFMILTAIVLLSSVGISFLDVYTNIGSSCTFEDTFIGNVLRYGTLLVPEWILLLYTAFAYYKIHKKIKAVKLALGKTEAIKRLFVFSMIIFLSCLPLSITRIIQLFNIKSCYVSYASTIAFGIYALRGFINAFAYIWAFRLFLVFANTEKLFLRTSSANSAGTESTNLLFESFSN